MAAANVTSDVGRKIATCLWFEQGSREAAEFWTSLFPDSRIVSVGKIAAGPGAGNDVVEFELCGRPFTALDGGPMFKITPAISLVVNCDSQEEIDRYWEALSDGGREGYCGWLDDRFGVSWQVLPAELGALMKQSPEEVMKALLTMTRIDLAALRRSVGAS